MEDKTVDAAADTATEAPQNVLLMPRYLCHKTVRAAKIIAIIAGTAASTLNLLIPGKNEQEENATLAVEVDEAWLTRNPKLEVGGYFVEYELMPGETEPYTAYSPAAALESGYSLITDMGNAVPPPGLNISAVEDQVKIQCQNGNWNHNPYMFGMANGLICALATIKGEEPEYLTAPDTWIGQKNESLQVEEAQPVSSLPPYQQRVVDECEQLDDRLSKLKAFFDTETFANLTHEKQHLLKCQADHMANYSQVLHFRISEF